jgi:hypothetical protein
MSREFLRQGCDTAEVLTYEIDERDALIRVGVSWDEFALQSEERDETPILRRRRGGDCLAMMKR